MVILPTVILRRTDHQGIDRQNAKTNPGQNPDHLDLFQIFFSLTLVFFRLGDRLIETVANTVK